MEFSNATAMCLKYPYVQYICKLERLRAAMLLSEKQKMSLRWDEKVTGEKNLELYQELTTKHLHAIYADHPKCIGTCLENGESSFKLLGIEQQVMLLCDIVEYTSFQLPECIKKKRIYCICKNGGNVYELADSGNIQYGKAGLSDGLFGDS